MGKYGAHATVKGLAQKHRTDLRAKRHVIGMAPGKHVRKGAVQDHSGYALVVFVRQKLPLEVLAAEDVVPDEIEGIETDVVAMDPPVIQSQGRHRPAPGGVSIGHYRVTAGTLGAVVVDQISGSRVVLSNNHVLANSNTGKDGDPIYQPAAYDGGTRTDTIAALGRYVPLKIVGGDDVGCILARGVVRTANWLSGLCGRRTRITLDALPSDDDANLVDAALGVPVRQEDIIEGIYQLGPIVGIAEAHEGDRVTKWGRTTLLTRGEVLYVGAEVEVGFGGGRTAWFVDQIICDNMSAGGDSGSVICREDPDGLVAVGLLFAGSATHTIANRIQHVVDLLQVDIGAGHPI